MQRKLAFDGPFFVIAVEGKGTFTLSAGPLSWGTASFMADLPASIERRCEQATTPCHRYKGHTTQTFNEAQITRMRKAGLYIVA